jgi:PAS domain S-box-containing protein
MRNTRLHLGNIAAPARAAAAMAILIGLAGALGWVFRIEALTSVFPSSAQMKINTAVGLVLSGAALLVLTQGASARLEVLAQCMSALAFLLGLTTLGEYYFGRSFGIDEFLVTDSAGAFNAFHGRMSPVTATAFVTLGFGLVALPHRRLRKLALFGGGCTLAIAGVCLIGYLWGASELTTDRWIPPVALNTAACFALLGGGLLIAPRRRTTLLDTQLANLAAVEIKILAGFIISLSLLLIGGSYTYRTSVRLADAVAWVAHTQEVRGTLQAVHGSLAGAEVSLRDYLLTKSDENVREYELLRREVVRQLEILRKLTADNPTQQHQWQGLQVIVLGRMAAMASTQQAFNDFGLSAARAVISVNRSNFTTQEVRVQMALMEAEEVRLLSARDSATASVRATTLMSLLGTMTLASALFMGLFRGIHREMRARRHAENSLRSSDHYNRSILDASPDCLGVLSLDGRLLHMTPHGMRLMEIDDFATVKNADWVKIWRGADRVMARAALQSARAGVDGRFQGTCLTVKGKPKWWDVIVMPILGADGGPARLLAVSRDITEVKRTENELRETNTFLDLLFETLPLMVYVKDSRTLRYIRLNRECERLTGFKRDAMIGKTALDIFPSNEAAEIFRHDSQVLTTGRPAEIEEQVTSTADRGTRIRHTMKVPILDDHGAAQYLLGISEDITEKKAAEKAIHDLNSALEGKARQLLATNQELESFSYSISHDLRAPLRAIDGFALMIEEDCRDALDAEGRRYLAVIRDNSKRMGSLIDDLLEFSRLGRLPVVTLDINVDSLVQEVVAEVLTVSEDRVPQMDIGPLPVARGDRGLLRQVWINLIANAVKYTGKQIMPRITVRGEQNDTEIIYSVSDNGVGFDMEYVGKLFGVFQRLHRADEFSGTGVGLAIVHRIVSRHGGRVWAEGKLNEGATFYFALPQGTEHG